MRQPAEIHAEVRPQHNRKNTFPKTEVQEADRKRPGAMANGFLGEQPRLVRSIASDSHFG
jgi:hypothetical protein